MNQCDKIRTLKAARPLLKNSDIARAVGCSTANVTQALTRIPVGVRGAHYSLSPDEMAFLKKEAASHNVTVEQMSALFLRDAIQEARENV